MASFFESLDEKQKAFIEDQKMYFVASAAEEGRVNLSPKGGDSLRVLSSSKIAWLNLTGSGNETAAHLLKKNRITLMWCSFDKQPLILRVYGTAKAVHPRDEEWNELIHLFEETTGARQVYLVSIDEVQTSCGFGVPYFQFEGHRDTLTTLWKKRGQEAVEAYWEDRNTKSIDGFETGVLSDL